MKRLLLTALLTVACLLAATAPVMAAEPAVTADDVIAYEGLAARLASDAPGVRSLYTVDVTKVTALEAEGYTVAYGAVMALSEKDGVTLTDGEGAPITARSLTVDKTENGYETSLSYAKAVTVYETDMPSYASGLHIYKNESEAAFAYTAVWSTDKYRTESVYEDTQLVFAAFLSLTKDGTTTTTYVYAEGDTFGTETATYGIGTSLYEISVHFLNDYRAAEGDTASVYAENMNLRRVVATSGIEDGGITASGATTLAATETTAETYVLTSSSAQSLSFTVNNAVSGIYRIDAKLNSLSAQVNRLTLKANGRHYAARVAAGETPAATKTAADYAVAADADYTNFSAYIRLDAGENNISLALQEAGAGYLGISAMSVTLVEEISPLDVVLGAVEDLNTTLTAATVTKENNNGAFGGVTTQNGTFVNNGSMIYDVHIPVSGKYSMAALCVANPTSTVTVSFVKDGETVAGSSFTATSAMKHANSSRAVQYVDAFGDFELPAGDYTMTLTSNNQFALSDMVLYWNEPEVATEEEAPIYTVYATDMTASGANTLLSDGATQVLRHKETLSFSVTVEKTGMYRLSGLTTLDGYIQYFIMTSDVQTKHCLVSRLGVSGATFAATDESCLVADKTATVTDDDILGFIYLTAGTHTLTMKNNSDSKAGAIGIYKVELSLETEQTEGSLYLSNDQNYTLVSGSFNTTGAQGGNYQLKGGAVVTYTFTPTHSGKFALYGTITGDVSKTTSFTVNPTGDTENAYETSIAFQKSKWSWGQNKYAIGNGSNAVINTKLGENITFKAGVEYTLTVDNTSGGNFGYTDFRFVRTGSLVTPDNYELLDVEWTADTALSGGLAVAEPGSITSEYLYVPKAGVTLYVKVAGKLSAYKNGEVINTYYPVGDSFALNASSAMNLVGVGYGDTDDLRASVRGGGATYRINVTQDATIIRLSVFASEADDVTVFAVGDAGSVVKLSEVDPETFAATVVSVDASTLGAASSASVTVSARGTANGTVLAMAYDKADYLVSVKTAAKTAFNETFTLNFTDALADVAQIRVLLVDGIETCTTLSDMTVVLEDETLTVSGSDYTLDPASLDNLASAENAFVVRPSDMTAVGLTTLSDGTLLFGRGASYYATFTVDAPVSGAYKIDMKYNRADNYIQYFYVYNQTYSAWGSGVRGEGRFGKSTDVSTATGDESFAVGNAYRYGEFDGTTEAYVWLNAGSNTLKIYMSSSATAAKLGVDALRFTADYTATADTVLIPYGNIKTPPTGYTNSLTSDSQNGNNGYFLRAGSTIYFNITVPEDGTYCLSSLASTNGPTTVSISSETVEFLPLNGTYQRYALGDTSTSILPVTLGELNLKAGTHTVALKVTAGWYHFNMLMLDRTGDYDDAKRFSVEEKGVDIDRETGSFTAKYKVTVVNGAFDNDLTAHLDVSGVDAGGVFSYALTEAVTVGNVTEFTFAGEARVGVEEIELAFSLWNDNETENTLLYSIDPLRYTSEAGLRVLVITDTHYTGLNENLKLYNYRNGTWSVNVSNATKYYNNYTYEYDIYGWTSDEKLQRIMDDLLLAYKNGEYDMIFHLGDAAMTDGNYGRFQQDNVRYEEALSKGWDVYSDPNSDEPLETFWEHPLNVSYVLKKQFFDQLSAAGIPYYVANGNHDYLYTYNDDKSDLDFTPWENLYHYAELFGHRTEESNGKYLRDDDGNYICYEDSDAANYVVRVIRRNGEVKILSALTESELEAFKLKHAGDGNCYDFYVSEDTLSSSDELLAAFVMSNGFQVNTYDFYTEKGVYYDETTGSYNYGGQTVRYSHLRDNMMHAMSRYAADFPVAYMVSHMVSSSHLYEYMSAYDNYAGTFYGDVHDEEHYYVGEESFPFWVAGCFSSVYDIDYYYNADGSADNQYYYSRSSKANGVGNQVWGDFTRHPFTYMTLEVHGDFSYAERVHMAFFYENGHQITLTRDEVTGQDIRYVRAVADASIYAAGETLYAAHVDGVTVLYRESELAAAGLTTSSASVRKVYVGGDASVVGSSYMYMKADYVENEYQTPDYIIDKEGNVYTTAMVKVGVATNTDGSAFSHTAAFAPRTDEGTAVLYNGETYYLAGAIGGVSGHYLYDEKGDYVYVDNDGNLVFYDPVEVDEDYIEASIQSQFVLNDNSAFTLYDMPHQRTWFYRASDGSFVSLDKDGDGKLDAGTYTDLYRTSVNEKHYEGADITPQIVIDENGKFVTGEGWAHFQYLSTYSYADGTVVESGENGDIAIDYDADGNIVYGMYIPYATYAGEWF